MLEQIQGAIPLLAICGGVLLLLAGQAYRLKPLLAKAWPARSSSPVATGPAGLTPTERFELYYGLRAWCEASGHTGAVKALDSTVLPALVQSGGSKP